MTKRAAVRHRPPSPSVRGSASPGLLHRQCSCGTTKTGNACSKCQGDGSLGAHAPLVQPKLTISQPDDIHEREADRVAAEIMTMPLPTSHRRSNVDIQKSELSDPEQGQAAHRASPDLTVRIASLRGGGTPLSREARAFMESRFGYDFSQVRVHAGPRAAEAAQSLNARAFTMGRDIAFGAGEYSPGTNAGKRLLAHELTHVVQQGQAHIHADTKLAVGRAGLRGPDSPNVFSSIRPARAPASRIRPNEEPAAAPLHRGARAETIQRKPFTGTSKADSRSGRHVQRPRSLRNVDRSFATFLTVAEGSPPNEIEAGFRYDGEHILPRFILSRLDQRGAVYNKLLQDEDRGRIPFPLQVELEGRVHTLRDHAEFVGFVTRVMKSKLMDTEDFKKEKADPKWAINAANAVVNLKRTDNGTYRVTVRTEPPVTAPEGFRLAGNNVAFCVDTSGSIGANEYRDMLNRVVAEIDKMEPGTPLTVHLIGFDWRVSSENTYGPGTPREVRAQLVRGWPRNGVDTRDTTPNEDVQGAVDRARALGATSIVVLTDAPPATYAGVGGDGVQVIQLDPRYRSGR